MTNITLLKILLRVGGVTSLFALFAVVTPMSWMVSAHRWLGLGEMPTAPAVEYLARSVSAFYALFGVLCLILATDVERYQRIVRLMGLCITLLGIVLLGIDVAANMPSWWIALEGPGAAVAGLLLAFLSGSNNQGGAPS